MNIEPAYIILAATILINGACLLMCLKFAMRMERRHEQAIGILLGRAGIDHLDVLKKRLDACRNADKQPAKKEAPKMTSVTHRLGD